MCSHTPRATCWHTRGSLWSAAHRMSHCLQLPRSCTARTPPLRRSSGTVRPSCFAHIPPALARDGRAGRRVGRAGYLACAVTLYARISRCIVGYVAAAKCRDNSRGTISAPWAVQDHLLSLPEPHRSGQEQRCIFRACAGQFRAWPKQVRKSPGHPKLDAVALARRVGWHVHGSCSRLAPDIAFWESPGGLCGWALAKFHR